MAPITVDEVLHLIRNPHGHSEERVRQARIAAGALIEKLQRERDGYKEAYESLKAWAEQNGLDTKTYG